MSHDISFTLTVLDLMKNKTESLLVYKIEIKICSEIEQYEETLIFHKL